MMCDFENRRYLYCTLIKNKLPLNQTEEDHNPVTPWDCLPRTYQKQILESCFPLHSL